MNQIDPQWVHQTLNGDDEAFARIVECMQTPVFNFCYRMLGDESDAEDASQETFWRAYKNLNKFDQQRPFGTWLLSIAAHHCIDRQRRHSLPGIPLDSLPEESAPDASAGPEHTLIRNLDQQRVHQALNKLSENDRAAVIFYYWYDYSYEEIARTLEITESALKSRLHRARILLANVYSENNNDVFIKQRRHHESPAF